MVHDPLSFLNTDDLVIYSVPMARLVGIAGSVLLSQFIAARARTPITHEGDVWVSLSTEELYELTGIQLQEQEHGIKKLTTKKLIKQKVFGNPSRRHFWLDEKKIIAISGVFA